MIDFPASPTNGQWFTDATSGNTWEFDGMVWTAIRNVTGLRIAGTYNSGTWTPIASAVKGDIYIATVNVAGFPGGPVNAGDGLHFDGTTWTNAGPMKGPQGVPGATGPEGPQGPPGPQGRPGSNGRDGRDGVAGPRGRDGIDGVNGKAASVVIGTTTTLPAGSAATVVNRGTSDAAVLDFGIPTGPMGPAGAAGSSGGVTGFKKIHVQMGPAQTKSITVAESPGTWFTDTQTITMPAGADRAIVMLASATEATLNNSSGYFQENVPYTLHIYFNKILTITGSGAGYTNGYDSVAVASTQNWASYTWLAATYQTWRDVRKVHIIEDIKFTPGAAVTFTLKQDYVKGSYVNITKQPGTLVILPYASGLAATATTFRTGVNPATTDLLAVPTAAEVLAAKAADLRQLVTALDQRVAALRTFEARPAVQTQLDGLAARLKGLFTTAGTAEQVTTAAVAIGRELATIDYVNGRFTFE